MGAGDQVRTAVADVGDEPSISAAIDAANAHAPLTIAIVNAGTGGAGTLLSMDLEEWERVLRTNLTGAFLTIKHAGTQIAANGGGSICAISSIAGTHTHRFMSSYTTSKAGLNMLVRNAADELGSLGVRVNAVAPGIVETELSDDETIRFVAEAVEATTGDVTAERAMMLAFLAAARYFTHKLAHCRGLADEALRIADLIDDPRARSYARFGKWQTCLGPDEIDEQQRLSIEARSFAAASGSLAIVNSGYGMGMSTAFDLGDLAEGRRLNIEALARLEGIDAPRFRWSAEGYDVLLKIADGRLDDAESAAHAVLDRASRIGEGVSASNAMLTFGAQVVNIRLLQGRGSEIVAILEGIDAGPAQLAYDAVRVAALAQARDPRADELIANLIESVVEARNDVLITTAVAVTADAAWSATISSAGVDSVAASRLADRIEPLAHLHAHLNTFGTGGFYMGSLLHGLGQARAAAGDTGDAAAAFDQAIGEHRRTGARGFEARSIEARGRLG